MRLVHVLLLCGSLALLTLAAGDGARGGSPDGQAAPVSGGLATLHLLDGETCSMSLLTGAPGGVVQDHELRNRGSHLVFGRYHAGEFTVGIQGGEAGTIVDLGTAEELRQRFGYGDTVPGRQGFSSLHLDGRRLLIRGPQGGEPFQPCPDADAVFAAGGGDHAPVALDHVYVLRITDRNDQDSELLAKLHVVGLVEGQSVTLRWERLAP